MSADTTLIVIAAVAILMTLLLAWEAWKLSRETRELFDPERNEHGDEDEP
ncbi:MAG: hypothetical protein GYB17_14855 [Gammaproteobacteria bacterium]|nr:hypothetical protein [Gammaproteobacteria bacterium]